MNCDLRSARIDIDLCLRLFDPYRRIGLDDRDHWLWNVDRHHGAVIGIECLTPIPELLRCLLHRLAGLLRVLLLKRFKGTPHLFQELSRNLLTRAVRLLARLLDLPQDLLQNLTGPCNVLLRQRLVGPAQLQIESSRF